VVAQAFRNIAGDIAGIVVAIPHSNENAAQNPTQVNHQKRLYWRLCVAEHSRVEFHNQTIHALLCVIVVDFPSSGKVRNGGSRRHAAFYKSKIAEEFWCSYHATYHK
jgi:hypothetical protein